MPASSTLVPHTKPAAHLSAHGLGYATKAGKTLLCDVDFELSAGTIMAIAGPNGAGKTTLMRLISGTLPPTQGCITINSKDLSRLSLRDRARRVALVSQDEMPDGRLPLRDYVALGQMPIWADYSRQIHDEALDHILELTDLAAKADQPIAFLSGGERQRAHIARALAQRPSVLLLDEPTNHLDPDAKGRMLSLVASLGITVVMILHDLVLIPEFASHVALVADGRLHAFGPTFDVLTPEMVRTTFGVEYLLLGHGDRKVPVVDIRKTPVS